MKLHSYAATRETVLAKYAALRTCPDLIAIFDRGAGTIEAHLTKGGLVFRALEKDARNWIVREAPGLLSEV